VASKQDKIDQSLVANTDKRVAEAEAFLRKHPEVRFLDVLFTGMSGVPRGKRIRRDELMPLAQQGRFLPGSILVVDITGQDCEETGLVWEDGDADRIARPVPGSLALTPWLGSDAAQVMVNLFELDGRPNDLDPRHVLARVVDRFEAQGLTPVVACELEFYLLEMGEGPEARPRPFGGASNYEVYGLRELADVDPWIRDLYTSTDAMGLPVETIISEYAPGQFELTLHHQPDALLACDHAIAFKRAVKGTALRHGAEACFMAKPFMEQTGSGFHIHVSLLDKQGQNIFAADDPAGTPALRYAIGGMKKLMPDSGAIFAPHANSYRRLKPNSYAPISAIWGVNNRTVSLRVPAGPPSSRHVEHRICGADANPYLAVATVLVGMHHGLEKQIEPGPAVVGNGYEVTPDPAATLPPNWFAAVDRFERSDILRDYLGARFVEKYAIVKRTEQARYMECVPTLDYQWYLRNV
jgi:glutamine synthetase